MAKRYSDGAYAGMDARKTEEMQDAGIIREDRSAVANLPQNVMYKAWGNDNDYLNARPPLNDDITGVDRQKREDVNGARKHLKNNKW